MAYVEIYWVGVKVHAGVLAGAPYTVPWNGYLRANLSLLLDDGDPVSLMAVATDMEGNTDTAYVTARYETDP